MNDNNQHTTTTMNKTHFYAFLQGYWDYVEIGSVPDYNSTELQVWAAGLQWASNGNREPTHDDFYELCGTH